MASARLAAGVDDVGMVREAVDDRGGAAGGGEGLARVGNRGRDRGGLLRPSKSACQSVECGSRLDGRGAAS